MTIGRSPDTEIFLDDVTVSRDHAVLVSRRRVVPRRFGLAQRNVREPPADRLAPAGGRRRAPDRQVQARRTWRGDGRLAHHRGAAGSPTDDEKPRKSLTIGAVCKALSQEFPDISIKDPLPGGPEAAVAAPDARGLPALRAVRRLAPAHDPAPAAGRVPAPAGDPPGAGRRPRRGRDAGGRPAGRHGAPGRRAARLTFSLRDRGALYSLDDVVEETGAEPRLVKEMEDFGIVKGEVRSGTTYYDETEREIVAR